MLSLPHPAVLLLAIPIVAIIVARWRAGFPGLAPWRRALLLALRLALVAVLLLALAGLALQLPTSAQATVFVADLSASNAGHRAQLTTLLRATLRHIHGQAAVVATGGNALVARPMGPSHRLGSLRAPIQAGNTNLQAGLQLASALIPASDRGRIVVLTDGRQTQGNAVATARHLSSRDRIDVIPDAGLSGPDVAVAGITVPPVIHADERFAVHVALSSNVSERITVTLARDGNAVARRVVRVHPGRQMLSLLQGPLPARLHTYAVRLSASHDVVPQNNRGSAVANVVGAPRILVIASHADQAANVVAALDAAGKKVDERTPAAIGNLSGYASVVIVDTSAVDLGHALMQRIAANTRQGAGLVVIGGPDAYGAGAYGATPLESVLPVSMTLPKHRKVPPVAVALIIESLEVTQDITISKRAAQGLVEMLTPNDEIGINDAPMTVVGGWVVPLQRDVHRAATERALARMVPGDPYTYLPFLISAAQVLSHAHAATRRIILVGDGDATDFYQVPVERIRRQGITVSTIGTNDALGMGNYRLMREIARWGGGTYYRARSSSQVPQFFLRQTRSLGRSAIRQGKIVPRRLVPSPLLRSIATPPPLNGYVETTLKGAAEAVLRGRQHDPILADWQVGLGRAVAWTSDASGLWTRAWLRSPAGRLLWNNLVAWSLPTSQPNSLDVSVRHSGGTVTVSAAVPTTLGTTPDVRATISGPGQTVAVQLQPAAPGRMAASFIAQHDGPYLVHVVASGAGRRLVAHTGLQMPISAEYRGAGANLPFMRTLARAGGGSILSDPVWNDRLPTVLSEQPLAPYLVILALFLFPAELTVRMLP